MHAAAEMIAHVDKPVFLYYFGDHDPSGVHIPVHVEKEIRKMAPDLRHSLDPPAEIRGDAEHAITQLAQQEQTA